MSDLLALEKITSADYATVKALVQGAIDTFMGFKFVRSQRQWSRWIWRQTSISIY
jgi:hypothetical protein